jgi:hypothetical protein
VGRQAAMSLAEMQRQAHPHEYQPVHKAFYPRDLVVVAGSARARAAMMAAGAGARGVLPTPQPPPYWLPHSRARADRTRIHIRRSLCVPCCYRF